jgi:hypothetical protein
MSRGPRLAIHVRNLREGEADTLPAELRNHGMAYLIPEWVWMVEPVNLLGPFGPPQPPFAIIVASQAHSWLVLWRAIAISPLPPTVPLNWFMEALPQVFAEARLRGCVGFMTLLADNRPSEVKMARIIASLPGATLLPFQGSLGIGSLSEAGKEESR